MTGDMGPPNDEGRAAHNRPATIVVEVATKPSDTADITTAGRHPWRSP